MKNVSFTPKDNPSGALYLPVSVWSVSFSRFYIYIHTHTHTHTSVCLCMCVHVRVCLCMCVCVFDPGISLHCHSVNFTFPSSVLFLFPEPLVFFFLDLLDYNIQWWNITSSNSLRENIQQFQGWLSLWLSDILKKTGVSIFLLRCLHPVGSVSWSQDGCSSSKHFLYTQQAAQRRRRWRICTYAFLFIWEHDLSQKPVQYSALQSQQASIGSHAYTLSLVTG